VIIIKSKRQIDGIRKSCQLAAQALKIIKPHVVAGTTTDELNERLKSFILEHGAKPAPLNYLGYPKETCISLNEVICHGIPGRQKLKNGDILNIDVTTILDGFYGDTSSMFVVGKIPNKTRKLLQITKECLNLGIAQIKPGNKTGAIGYAISRHAESAGYSVVTQFCAHGVGVEFHEDPQINHKAKKNDGIIMEPGMILTVEPMLNEGVPNVVIDEQDRWTARTADGKLSAQYEHTVLVTDVGHEILTIYDCDQSLLEQEKKL
jgi:methionyl aminopeptidase